MKNKCAFKLEASICSILFKIATFLDSRTARLWAFIEFARDSIESLACWPKFTKALKKNEAKQIIRSTSSSITINSKAHAIAKIIANMIGFRNVDIFFFIILLLYLLYLYCDLKFV